MAVTCENRHYHWYKIRRDHWVTTAAKVGIDSEVVNRIFQEIIESTPTVIDSIQTMIPAGFPLYLYIKKKTKQPCLNSCSRLTIVVLVANHEVNRKLLILGKGYRKE
ncbi:MAG: hypothetical protein ISR78_02380 [Spirochaetia bacterium]|nr:hypothetical protein [Spirochaetia bacterium]